jgi:hypothetical protein
MTGSVRALCDITMSYFLQMSRPVPSELLASIQHVIEDFLTNRVPYDGALTVLQGLAVSTEPLEKLNHILQTNNDPIPSSDESPDILPPTRKSRPWTAYEDQRLLCAMYRFGIDNWTAISKFVGNRRTRSQCSQRWYRGLDPSIAKSAWTTEEEGRLLAVVAAIGDRSWTRIASEMGNRSDVQCRYRYKHLQKIASRPTARPPQKLVLPPLSALTDALARIEPLPPLRERREPDAKPDAQSGV